MRRRALAILTSLIALPLLSSVPSAAVGPDVEAVRGTAAWPDWGLQPASLPCTGPAGIAAADDEYPTMVRQPATQAYGQRAAAFVTTEGAARGVLRQITASSTSFGLSLHTATDTTAVAQVRIRLDGNDSGRSWVGTDRWTEAGGGWRVVDVAQRLLSWDLVEESSGQVLQSAGPATFADFAADHPGWDYWLFTGAGCGVQTVHVDGSYFATSDPETPGLRFDLEAAESALVRHDNAADMVTAGQPVAARAMVTGHFGNGLAGVPVRLEAKGYGDSGFMPVVTLPADAAGKVTHDVKPLRRTVYRWVVDHTDAMDGDTSAELVMRVKTKITAAVADSSIRVGQTMVVTGRTFPAKPGVGIQLWRDDSTYTGILKRGTVRADGTYRIAYVPQKPGTYVVAVAVDAASGNHRNFSPQRTVKVAR